MNKNNKTEIEVLEGLEAVRRRPEQWIGSTDSRGMHQLVFELVYNCLDEFNAGCCHCISVTLNSDGSVTVEDDGPGMVTELSAKTGQSGVEMLFTTLGCPTGFALAVVNALSERLEVEVCRGGKLYKKSYQRGKSVTPLEIIGDTERHGTRVTILPDKNVFVDVYKNTKHPVFDFDTLATYLRELAFLNKSLRINLADPQNNKQEVFLFDAGISDYLSWLNYKHSKVNQAPIYFSTEFAIPNDKDRLNIECAIQWTDRTECLALDFFNSCPIRESFSIGDISAELVNPLNEYARTNQLISEHEQDISNVEISKGISTILSIKSATTLRWLGKQNLHSVPESGFGSLPSRFLTSSMNRLITIR